MGYDATEVCEKFPAQSCTSRTRCFLGPATTYDRPSGIQATELEIRIQPDFPISNKVIVQGRICFDCIRCPLTLNMSVEMYAILIVSW